uniref:R2R3-MYB transcription factor 45 n=1 Tax=Taxus chinensis TaxID=29808 RepID=A0A6B9QW73_TAXCH|nr:R2R3-MYB transcription factor 45 [Taxus chinensis]
MASLKSGEEVDRIKGPWSPEEDAALQRYVQQYGPRNWSLISKAIPGRSGKSCRLRWCNQLSPRVEHRPFTPQEDAAIIRAHSLHGNKWATIARMLSGRTDNGQGGDIEMAFPFGGAGRRPGGVGGVVGGPGDLFPYRGVGKPWGGSQGTDDCASRRGRGPA